MLDLATQSINPDISRACFRVLFFVFSHFFWGHVGFWRCFSSVATPPFDVEHVKIRQGMASPLSPIGHGSSWVVVVISWVVVDISCVVVDISWVVVDISWVVVDISWVVVDISRGKSLHHPV